MFTIQIGLYCFKRPFVLLLQFISRMLSTFPQPMLKVISDIVQIRDGFPGVMLVGKVFPLDKIVRFICLRRQLLSMTASSRMVSTSQTVFIWDKQRGLYQYQREMGPINIFIMQQKLIITLWKAQFKEISKDEAIYCRLTYNNTERNSKSTTQEKNLVWKQTFIFPLSKQDVPLKLEFINLKEGQAIHFAKDQVAESLSFAKSTIDIPLNNQHHGSLPCKVDIIDNEQEPIGKIFIQYEVMKTEVAYTVEKQMDYLYLLKLTNFRVSFVRRLKNNPKFYLYFNIEGREHKEDLPFEYEQNGTYVYNYPVKLYLKKQIQAQIQLYIKQQQSIPEYSTNRMDYQTESSFSDSIFSEKKTFKSSIGKKDRLLLEVGKEKISAIFDLTFKRDVKVNRKLPLNTMIKFQKREIGQIQFQAQSFFRSKEELQELQEQKKGLNPEKDGKTVEKKKVQVKQSNGVITINSILGKLQLFNQSIIDKKNMSLEIKLGNQIKESSLLQRPGKEIIFIDTFVFKRMWEQTMKMVLNLHSQANEKMPTFFTELKLRQLFQIGRYVSKKIKLKDQHNNYSGELIIDMEYKEIEEKKSPSLKESMAVISEIPQEEVQEIKARKKREEIEERMKARQQVKEKSKELNSMSTLAVLESNDIILPPLRSISRLSTINHKPQKFKGANVFNVNGSIKFSRSPRFENKTQREGYESYSYVRESDFNLKSKRGASIGRGQKYDFTKVYSNNPGAGRYEIPSVWDKYK